MKLTRPWLVLTPRGWILCRTYDALDRAYQEAFAASWFVQCKPVGEL